MGHSFFKKRGNILQIMLIKMFMWEAEITDFSWLVSQRNLWSEPLDVRLHSSTTLFTATDWTDAVSPDGLRARSRFHHLKPTELWGVFQFAGCTWYISDDTWGAGSQQLWDVFSLSGAALPVFGMNYSILHTWMLSARKKDGQEKSHTFSGHSLLLCLLLLLAYMRSSYAPPRLFSTLNIE